MALRRRRRRGRKLGRKSRGTLKLYVRNITVRIMYDIDNELRKTTPVDTGRARSGWRVARAASRRYGQGAWIYNRVPYIKYLNEGWSKQAPAGFVQKTIRKVLRKWKASRRASIGPQGTTRPQRSETRAP